MAITIVKPEDLQDYVGKELEATEWFKVDQDRINKFADATEDHQFIHVDSEKATPIFGSTIAHGFLVLSLASKFSLDVLGQHSEKSVSINYGFDKVRFISPVTVNSFVRGRFNLKRVDINRPTELRQIYDLSIEIKGLDRPAIIAEWITLTIYNN